MFLKIPLLLGLFALGSPVCGNEFIDISKSTPMFAMCVEYAVYQFNRVQVDPYAYKLLWVQRSQTKPFTWIYSMNLKMGRTMCEKHLEDIDNCPLQEGSGKKNVDCTFVVDALPWLSQCTLQYSTCVQT
ncbi:PREDICTED: probable cystatin-15 [Miniopterus natalensis]|uniref:probable cystatin-15 n=1 Tax=Miniopterus natalensis TaxID=291302 RepID=UPI0007A71C7A|nr:PREDICTED: probable cystatin-15 [Miniopterus natalensis]